MRGSLLLISCYHARLIGEFGRVHTDLIIWLCGIALEVLVLFRGWKGSLLKKYPYFYAYIGCVFTDSVIRFFCYTLAPNLYRVFYWSTEPITIVAGYAVVLEIFRQGLRHSYAVSRVARKLLFVVLVVALTYAASDLVHGGFSSLPRATQDLGRSLQYIKGALLLVMIWFFARYRFSFGRNLLGLTAGYTLFVGFDVLTLAFLFLPSHPFSFVLKKLHSIIYVITLLIWCITLWSASPEPAEPPESVIDRDYDLLAAKTMAVFNQLSARGGRALRP
jgi:hypothetical protein